jgi:hypothetical protein
MPERTVRCDNCGYTVRWNPETLEGPRAYLDRGECPSCEHYFEHDAPSWVKRDA